MPHCSREFKIGVQADGAVSAMKTAITQKRNNRARRS
jgi:hypothetical protein